MVLFWNHGGGSVTGVAFDENYRYDSLTLSELYEAFGAVYPLSAEVPPIDVIGFDACLMATIDTAYMLADVAHCLVASEEVVPGVGFEYSGWLGALAGDTITTLHYAASISGDDDFVAYEVDTFTLEGEPRFEEIWLGDGRYMMLFELVDARDTSAWSETVVFTVEGEEIYTATEE